MKEYITKDRAKQFVCGHCNEVCSEEPCEPSACDWMVFIDKEPAADVVEVRRGRWIEENGIQICSECGEEHEWEDYRAPYCDTCGARMNKEEANERMD